MVKQLEKWAEVKNYDIDGEVVVAKGLPYLVGYSYIAQNSLYWVSIPLAPETWDKTKTKELQKALKGIKGFGGATYSKKQGELTVQVKHPMLGGVEKLFSYFEEITAAAVKALQDLGAQGSDLCHLCKKPGSDSYTSQTTYVYPAHSQCLADKASKELGKITGGGNAAVSGSRSVLGIVLAFLFAIGGYFLTALVVTSVAIIDLLLTPLHDYLVDILFIVIPFAAFIGYQLGVGKYRRVRVIPIVVVTLVSTLVLDLILEYIGFASEFGITLSVGEFLNLVNHPQIRPYVIKDMVLPFVFTAVGLVAAYFTILRSANAALEETAKNLAKTAGISQESAGVPDTVASGETAAPSGEVDDRFAPRDFSEFTPGAAEDRFSRPAEDFSATGSAESQLPDPEIK